MYTDTSMGRIGKNTEKYTQNMKTEDGEIHTMSG
jgi:hypothetical protein